MKNKDQFLQIRVTPAQKAATRARAAQADMEMSSYVLAQLIPAPRKRFDEIVASLAADPARCRFALAALNDFLTEASATEFVGAVSAPPTHALDAYLANYTAAMVETAAHRFGVTAPAWTETVPPLREPAFGSELPKLRLHLLLKSPPAFRRRNIFVDATIGSRV
jgi:uncharacterized protein (DUF1778 family)